MSVFLSSNSVHYAIRSTETGQYVSSTPYGSLQFSASPTLVRAKKTAIRQIAGLYFKNPTIVGTLEFVEFHVTTTVVEPARTVQLVKTVLGAFPNSTWAVSVATEIETRVQSRKFDFNYAAVMNPDAPVPAILKRSQYRYVKSFGEYGMIRNRKYAAMILLKDDLAATAFRLASADDIDLLVDVKTPKVIFASPEMRK